MAKVMLLSALEFGSEIDTAKRTAETNISFVVLTSPGLILGIFDMAMNCFKTTFKFAIPCVHPEMISKFRTYVPSQ